MRWNRMLPVLGLFAAALVLSGTELLKNGDFSRTAPSGAPESWNFHVSGDARAVMRTDQREAYSGSRSLRISSQSGYARNVFASLQQEIVLRPGVEYELEGVLKGKNASALLFCTGQKWVKRFRTEKPGNQWSRFRFRFTLTGDEVGPDGKVPFAIIVDNLAEEIWLDGLRLAEAGRRILPADEQREAGIWRILPFSGNPAELTSIPADAASVRLPLSAANCADKVFPPANDFSAGIGVAYDAGGLIFFAEAKDSTPNIRGGGELWRGDSVQIRIDRAGIASPKAEESDLEFGLAVDSDSAVRQWSWTLNSELPAGKVSAHGVRTAQSWFAAIRLNWQLLSPLDYPRRRTFTFNAVFNASDVPGQRAVYFLAPGLHDTKSAEFYPRAILVRPGEVTMDYVVQSTAASDAFAGKLYGTGFSTAAKLEARVVDSAGKSHHFPLSELPTISPDAVVILDFRLPLEGLPEGAVKVEFLADGTAYCGFDGKHSDPVRLAASCLDGLLVRLEQLSGKVERSSQKNNAYLSLPLAVLQDHLPALKKNMNSNNDRKRLLQYAERIEMIAPGCREAMDRLEEHLQAAAAGALPLSWKLADAPVDLVRGWPWSRVENSAGETVYRPVMFDGYGHFAGMRQSLERMPTYGANMIQLEYGPRSTLPREGKETEYEPDLSDFERSFLPLVEQCRRSGLRLCVLLSPHLIPAWWLEKHPELKQDSGFLKYDIANDESRAMLKAHIHALVGRLRKLPDPNVIHSICLLNEPVYTPSFSDPAFRNRFAEWLDGQYGSLEAFNRAAGRRYAGYPELFKAGLADRVIYSEWGRFRAGLMNSASRFLSDEVRKAWPEIPVHTKIMISDSLFLDHAIDPEAYAAMSDYNGNDNYSMFKEGGFLSDWLKITLGDELQYSMKPVSIINSENHIIRDNESRPVPNRHVYLANFMQHLTGASALVTWVWEPFAPECVGDYVKDLRGNIALRPGNIIAQGMAHLDAMRLAPELRRFTAEEPEIAFLYSPTSIRLQPDVYRNALLKAYETAAYTGYRVGFLSEKQLADGNYGKAGLLVASGVTNLDDTALAGLQKFVSRGGRVAADSHSLKRNQLDREISLDFTPIPLPEESSPRELGNLFATVSKLPFSLDTPGNQDGRGIFFRVAASGKPGEYLVCLVNYTDRLRHLRLNGVSVLRDLITETGYAAEFDLQPLELRLLQVIAQ